MSDLTDLLVTARCCKDWPVSPLAPIGRCGECGAHPVIQPEPKAMTQAEADALEAIENIPSGDPEYAHGELDRLLREAVHPRIREAAQALEESCAWWATA